MILLTFTGLLLGASAGLYQPPLTQTDNSPSSTLTQTEAQVSVDSFKHVSKASIEKLNPLNTWVSQVNSGQHHYQSIIVPSSANISDDLERSTVNAFAPQVTANDVKKTQPAAYKTEPYWFIQWPFPVGVKITSPFGSRTSPCGGCSSYHEGTDFGAGGGSKIQAIAKGIVIRLDDAGGGMGYHLTIRSVINGTTIDTYYAHMQTNSSTFKVGDTVNVGDFVGLVGSTGSGTGPHLHLGIRVNGMFVNPYEFLSKYAGKYSKKSHYNIVDNVRFPVDSALIDKDATEDNQYTAPSELTTYYKTNAIN